MNLTLEALKRFGLSRVWWLMSPGNPLKVQGPAPMDRRSAHARALMQHPRVVVTDIEARLKSRYTARTVQKLCAIYPGVRFVWLMGADNLAQLHKWQRWRQIALQVPLGVIARPGDRISARTSPAARVLRNARMSGQTSLILSRTEAPAWCFVNVPMIATSSSAIRRAGHWNL